jgi:hypothetical protein
MIFGSGAIGGRAQLDAPGGLWFFGRVALTNSHRILRRIAGRMRMEAMNIEEPPIATKLLLMATELEDLAEDKRAKSARRN